nr:unnamed protein product [Callosobruchus chinensis]
MNSRLTFESKSSLYRQTWSKR